MFVWWSNCQRHLFHRVLYHYVVPCEDWYSASLGPNTLPPNRSWFWTQRVINMPILHAWGRSTLFVQRYQRSNYYHAAAILFNIIIIQWCYSLHCYYSVLLLFNVILIKCCCHAILLFDVIVIHYFYSTQIQFSFTIFIQ